MPEYENSNSTRARERLGVVWGAPAQRLEEFRRGYEIYVPTAIFAGYPWDRHRGRISVEFVLIIWQDKGPPGRNRKQIHS